MKLHIDFETKSAVDLIKAGSHAYASHPSTDVLCMGYAFGDEPVQLWLPNQPLPKRVVDHVANGQMVCAWNLSGFEFLIWNRILVFKYGAPMLVLKQCQDTMALAYAMALPGQLQHAAPALGLPHQKDMKGHRVMLKLSQPKKDGTFWTPETAPEDFAALYAYCPQDVEVERAADRRLVPLSDKEQRLWELDNRINARGVYIDKVSAIAAIKVVECEVARLNDQMMKATGGAVEACTNTKALATWVRYRGIETPGVAKADITDLLLRDELPGDVREALLIRQEAGKSSTAKLESVMESLSQDGRIRGCFQYHGASTGRFAGRRVQLQNFPRPKIKQKDIEKIFEILGAVD